MLLCFAGLASKHDLSDMYWTLAEASRANRHQSLQGACTLIAQGLGVNPSQIMPALLAHVLEMEITTTMHTILGGFSITLFAKFANVVTTEVTHRRNCIWDAWLNQEGTTDLAEV